MRFAFKIASLALALATTLVEALLTEAKDDAYQLDVLDSPKHLLVQFVSKDYHLQHIAPAYAAKLSIVRMKTAIFQVHPSKFDIQGFPALVLFFRGKYVAGMSGEQSRSQIKTFLNHNLPQ
ncbi:hypothetical protein BGZ82_011416 [Podila clonocystis]|nr:hypothetical protein BGZ82_011416 [Podila clonocystis]